MILRAIRDASRDTFRYAHRSERLEHWAFLLLTSIGVMLFYLCGRYGWNTIFPINWMFVALFAWLAMANVAVMVRRLHDHNLSGFWLFIPLIPLAMMFVAAKILYGSGVGFFTADQGRLLFQISQGVLVTTLIVFGSMFVRPGDKRPNRFGPAP